MRISSFSVLALGFGLVGLQLSACSNSSEDCTALATCSSTAGTSHAGSAGKNGNSGTSGTDAGAPGGGTPSIGGSVGSSGTAGTNGNSGAGGEGGSGPRPCTGDVADDAACWTSNQYGVFVSSETGNDATGDGTQEAPFATITKGIGAAAGKNVYVCLGAMKDTYAEKVTLDATTDGVRIYGGFDCADWSYSTTRKSSVVSPEVIALRITSLKKGAHIENMRFTAADGNGTDASSYGAFVTNSQSVALTRVELKAAAGLKGAKGDDGVKGIDASKSGAPPVGSSALCAPFPPQLPTIAGGKWNGENSCGSIGGPGGTGLKNGSNGPSGGAGSPTDHLTSQDIENGGPGETSVIKILNGATGVSGENGALGTGAPSAGVFSVSGFTSANGNAGTSGYPGQGGGGGGASIGNSSCYGASGGAGGMAGCAGTPGQGGIGGGASVGLLSWQSDVALDACLLTSGTGGAGGAGGKGGASGIGAPGGAGGDPVADGTNTIARAGQGGPGGNGGLGGSGSGGTGGPSYALAYSGPKPTYDVANTTLTPAAGGAKGVGGQAGAKAPDGSVGDAAAEFMVP